VIGHGGSEAVEGGQDNCEQAPTGNWLATLLWRLVGVVAYENWRVMRMKHRSGYHGAELTNAYPRHHP
jgi:hypothetical protein